MHIVKPESRQTPLPPGLYLVATPIGNLKDITFRALETLVSVNLIACEDTRVTAKLLKHYGIVTRTDSYHEHNAESKRPALLSRIAGGASIALVSDAGTPLVSDPGYKLVREAIEKGLRVEALPGASSALAALCVSGLPTDRFCFCGFLPAKESAARRMLEEVKVIPASLIFFVAARQLGTALQLMSETLGDRSASMSRELTKLYEETRRGGLAMMAKHYAEKEVRGEIVIVIGPPQLPALAEDEEIMEKLREAMTRMSLKDAAAAVTKELGIPRARAYALALSLRKTP